jgi:dsRNA-specific ribonuclease
VGALFVDSKFDYREVERFFQLHIQPYFEDMSLYDTFANKHPTVSDKISEKSVETLTLLTARSNLRS